MSWDDFLKTLAKAWDLQIIHVDGRIISIGNLLIGMAVVIFGFWASRFLSRQLAGKLLSHFGVDAAFQNSIQTLSSYVLTVTFFLLGLSLANIPMAVFTFAGGALAIGVGFGSQNVLNNFISGIILMLERPIKVGDYVELDGVFGRVQRIGFRSTTVLAVGNRDLVVPNSSFLEKNVLNWTLTDKLVRVKVDVGVAYGSPVRKVESLLKESIQSEPLILKAPEALILFKDFSDSTLNFEVTFTIELNELRDMEWVASNLRYIINEKFEEAKIVIAFPQRDVHFSASTPIDVRVRKE